MDILFLGTAGALPSVSRGYTALAIRAGRKVVLVDTGDCAIQKMLRVGWNPLDIEYIFITHLHPDHSSGLPSIIHILWMMGRRSSLSIFTPKPFASEMQSIITAYGLDRLEGLTLKVSLIRLADSVVVEDTSLEIHTFPVRHSIPNVGVKVVYGGKKVVYTSDTEPCEAVVRNAGCADILIHESNESAYITGGQRGHSTARDAGRIAHQSGVGELFLVHLGPALMDREKDIVREAREEFGGKVTVPNDLDVLTL